MAEYCCGTKPGSPIWQVLVFSVQDGFGRFCGELSAAHGVLAVCWPRTYSSNHGQLRSSVPPAAP